LKLNKKYEIIHLSDSNIVNKGSEIIYEILKCNSTFSVALAEVRGKNSAHYHNKLTEVYHIVDGSGILVLNNEEVSVQKGDTILIYPETVHQIKSDYIKILVIATPPFSEKDYFEVSK